MQDPEVLPNAADRIDKVNTPDRDVAEVSFDFTLLEKGEGDNISGNK